MSLTSTSVIARARATHRGLLAVLGGIPLLILVSVAAFNLAAAQRWKALGLAAVLWILCLWWCVYGLVWLVARVRNDRAVLWLAGDPQHGLMLDPDSVLQVRTPSGEVVAARVHSVERLEPTPRYWVKTEKSGEFLLVNEADLVGGGPVAASDEPGLAPEGAEPLG